MNDLSKIETTDMEYELMRRACAADGHGPDTVIRTGDGQPICAYCRCMKCNGDTAGQSLRALLRATPWWRFKARRELRALIRFVPLSKRDFGIAHHHDGER